MNGNKYAMVPIVSIITNFYLTSYQFHNTTPPLGLPSSFPKTYTRHIISFTTRYPCCTNLHLTSYGNNQTKRKVAHRHRSPEIQRVCQIMEWCWICDRLICIPSPTLNELNVLRKWWYQHNERPGTFYSPTHSFILTCHIHLLSHILGHDSTHSLTLFLTQQNTVQQIHLHNFRHQCTLVYTFKDTISHIQ